MVVKNVLLKQLIKQAVKNGEHYVQQQEQVMYLKDGIQRKMEQVQQ